MQWYVMKRDAVLDNAWKKKKNPKTSSTIARRLSKHNYTTQQKKHDTVTRNVL